MIRLSKSVALVVFISLGSFSFVGCGNDGPEMIRIRGDVSYKGAPLTDGMVVYLPAGGTDTQQASGRIQPDGTFELTTSKKGDGVRVGEYSIIVQAYSQGARSLTREETEAGARVSEPRLLIPKRYIDPVQSGLKDTVNSDHSGFKRIELTD